MGGGHRERETERRESMRARVRGVWRKWPEDESTRQEMSSFLICDSYWGYFLRGKGWILTRSRIQCSLCSTKYTFRKTEVGGNGSVYGLSKDRF